MQTDAWWQFRQAEGKRNKEWGKEQKENKRTEFFKLIHNIWKSMAPCCVMLRTKGQTRPTLEPAALLMETPVTWSSSGWTCEGRRVAPPSVPSNPPPQPICTQIDLLTSERIIRIFVVVVVVVVALPQTSPKKVCFDTAHAWRFIRFTMVSLFVGLSWKWMYGLEGTLKALPPVCVLGPPQQSGEQHACSGNTNLDNLHCCTVQIWMSS